MQTIRIENRTIIRVLVLTAVFLLVIKLVEFLLDPLIWIAASFFLTVALNPAVDFLGRFMPRKNRFLSISLVLISFTLVLGFLLYSFLPPLISQTQDLVESIPSALHQLQSSGPFSGFFQQFDLSQRLQNFSGEIFKYLSSASGSAIDVLNSVFSGFAAVITIFTLTFFMLLEAPRWVKNFWALTPEKRREKHMKIAREMYRAVTGYVNGNFFTSAIASVTSAIALVLVGVPFAIPLGLLVGILDLIPLVGATLAAIIVVLVSFFTSPTAGIIMIIFFVIYQQIENNILQPLVYGKSTELSPLVVTIAILIGTVLAGIFGALVAIPVAACIKVILMYIYGDKLKYYKPEVDQPEVEKLKKAKA